MERFVRHRLVVLFVLAVMVSGCAAGRAFRKGRDEVRLGNWDAAVTHFTRAVQEDPDNAVYKIELERAMQTAAREHISRARELEEKDQLDAALMEYRRAMDLDATNRLAAARVTELEKIIRDRIEASRPRPTIDRLRDQARTQGTILLDPSSREPLRLNFGNSSLKDILNFLGTSSGINITYDQTFQDKPYAVNLEGVTLEQALQQIMTANGLFYKVLNPKTIIVVPNNAAKHAEYDELVVRVFYISHADVAELSQVINTIMRIPTMPVQPTLLPNKTANTITVRATAPVVEVIERIIRANDKPRAEVIVDIQILEVSRQRLRNLGINLSNYALGLTFSPEVAPPNTSGGIPPGAPPPFNMNTISQGVSTADFYLTVPTAVLNFLAEDTSAKLIAKPQLRGAEGEKLTLNLGDEIPVLSTVFGSAAAGGFANIPQSSFNYRPVGVNVEMTPRVTFEGDIVLDGLSVESSTLGPSISVAGQAIPSFGTRKVTTTLRLREGESNLLAGLLRDEQRKILRGFPGVINVPVLRSLFGQTDDQVTQTDIVMLLTPRIVRTHQLTADDLAPIFIGTQQNVGLGGPPPLIAPPATPDPAAPGAPGTAAPGTGAAPAGGAPGTAQTGVPGPPVAGVPGVPPTQPSPQPGTFPTPTQPAPVTPVPTFPPPPAGTPPPTGTTPPAGTPPTGAPATPPAGTPLAGTVPPRDPNVAPTPAAGVTPPGATSAQVILTTPGTEMRIAGGPYTAPISINNASRVSTMTLTVTYNPNVLRVRTVQDGTFMRQGGASVTFTPRIDAAAGRVDIAIARTGDQVGATGAGLLGALVLDAVGAGGSTIQVSGIASTPEGAPVSLQFSPVTVTVR
jgi:type II secretory pathway component GspD/PulD (secretin)